MSGNVWMFSDQIDDEDMEFMQHEYVTYNMASEYYGLGCILSRGTLRAEKTADYFRRLRLQQRAVSEETARLCRK